MLRVYSAAEVHAALDWPRLAAAIERLFLAQPTVPVRHVHALAERDHLLLMPAWDERFVITKLVTVLPAATPSVQATVLVVDRASGAPLAALDGEAVTLRRTAATSALVAARLAPRPERLLVIGTGQLAPWLARAHLALNPRIECVSVWGRRHERAQACAAAIAASPECAGRPVEVADVLAEAVAQSGLISAATTADAPIICGEWLAPGTHLDLVGGFRRTMREADDEAVRKSRILVDTYAGALSEAGDLVQPLEQGVISRDAIKAELSEWLAGAHPVRESASDITLFKSVGTAVEDLAAVHCLLA
ncbi:MAG: ornithine cyclodeaminase family protein [Casimicrobiaceae bacterium]|nr:ornithine cyclodeaminase family protein [Casimicrobiaceae bacterium]MDW8312393.1 ornithine cyclodeaminase family protein [Burkholderiales bacterium]